MADQETIQCVRTEDQQRAFEGVARLLLSVKPYCDYKFGPLANVLLGQISRSHYAFALQGKSVVGYAGWALCEPEVARDWIEGRRTPLAEECAFGSVVVLTTFHAQARAAVFALTRHMRKRYPGHEFVFRRDYGDRWRTNSVRDLGQIGS